MSSLETRVLHAISRHKLLRDGDHVVVAVSGGADSVALLILLAKLLPACRLTAAYIDHQLRPQEAEREKRLVADLCRHLQLDHRVVAIEVEQQRRRSKESPEACARQLRYRALEEIRSAVGAALIGVGHTSDDQAEEVLIRLMRGTGPKGLSGMTWKRGRIIRPLLGIAKRELTTYLQGRGIDYCFDSSNLSRRFLRNKVRLDLLPLLEREYNPAIRKILLNTSAILAAEEDYLQAEVDRIYASVVTRSAASFDGVPGSERSIACGRLLALHPALQRRIVERLCWQSGCRPNFWHIENIIRFAEDGTTGSTLDLPGSVRVCKEARNLAFLPLGNKGRDRGEKQFGPPLVFAGEETRVIADIKARIEIRLAGNWTKDGADELAIDADTVEFPLTLRSPLPGERFTPLGAPGSKKVSRFFSDRKVARHRRHRYPVLTCRREIVAIPGLAVSEACKVTPQTRRFLVIDRRELDQPGQIDSA